MYLRLAFRFMCRAVLGSLTVVCACRCPRMYVSVIQIDFFVDRGRRIQRGNSMYVVVERIHPWPCYLISLHILVLSCVRFFSVSCIFRQLNLDFFLMVFRIFLLIGFQQDCVTTDSFVSVRKTTNNTSGSHMDDSSWNMLCVVPTWCSSLFVVFLLWLSVLNVYVCVFCVDDHVSY